VKRRLLVGVGALCAVLVVLTGARLAGQAIGGTGVALTPSKFPRHGAAEVRAMFDEGKTLGKYAVFIYQWSQEDRTSVARTMMEMSKDAGYTPILALSPTTLTEMRGKLDMPSSVQRRAGRRPTFTDKNVHIPFIQAALELAELKPPYLCLATEINFLAFAGIEEYVKFAAVYKRLYKEVKKVSPQTKVFVSFQWDYFQIMATREPKRISEHRKLIDIFRPELDVVAFTSYPSDHYKAPAEVPANYYDRISEYVKPSDEIHFMEIGWPTSGTGTEAEQVAFIERLPSLMAKIKPRVVAWSLLHDVDTSSLGGDLASTGLKHPDGRPKAGYISFSKLAGK
jgi:hypothetical protein